MSKLTRHILIIEDETKIAQLLSDYLQQSSFDTSIVADGSMAVDTFHETSPDLVLLDLMLPGKDGIEICREIRMQSQVPIIMITARVDEIDRLLGLELGADDYICKPFSPREVVARVRAVLRRALPTRSPCRENILSVDEQTHQVQCNGNLVSLTVVEFRLLATLCKHPGRIYSRDQLMSFIYDDNRVVTRRTIDTHVKNVRKKMQVELPDSDIIHAVYGLGYKLEL